MIVEILHGDFHVVEIIIWIVFVWIWVRMSKELDRNIFIETRDDGVNR